MVYYYLKVWSKPDENGISLCRQHFKLVEIQRTAFFLADGGYSGKNFADSVKDLHGATVEIVKKSGLPEFTVIPKRWIV